MHKFKPQTKLSHGFVVERWTGKAWYPSMCSPYKTMSEVRKHLEEYSWHYTIQNPYRVKDFVPKKNKYSNPIKKRPNWHMDDEYQMVVKI